MDKDGVLIAIDWENIRHGAQNYQESISPTDVTDAMRSVGQIFGDVRGGKVFGDWSIRKEDAVDFTSAGIELYNVPRTIAGKDRSDSSVILEVYDWIRDREDCKFIILGSGDSDYQALVDRAKSNGILIIMCAFSDIVARDMLAATPLFPLEAQLGIKPSEMGEVTYIEKNDSWNDVSAFIRQMSKLESNMNFIGYSKLCNKWMIDWGVSVTEQESYKLVDRWMNEGIVEKHDVPNPNNPNYPTSAIRLVRSNETVRKALGFDMIVTDVTDPSHFEDLLNGIDNLTMEDLC